ncbi:uncharacterized protein LTR77_008644 [Saxophila tyrrhenica]|uniref:alpha-galactosidase n=1 Tax=Saxophila tyrrhenica TaxID=1690608 RepID=A0AAV9P2N7_9PEZI|nr:hypothetical protein LTR77_008644 [Saxophila tyrrhenica]
MARTLRLLSSLTLFTLSLGLPLDDILLQIFQNIHWLPNALAQVTSDLAPRAVSFQPKAGATFNIELSVVPKTSEANDQSYHVWDFDMFDAPTSTIKAFQDKGHPVICYFSAGSYEDWRGDADDFPSAALGEPLGGWEGEYWLDTRNQKIRSIMAKRIALAASKGCDAVDPDNVDGYTNPTGFDLTKADAVDYLKFLANEAHSHGMACGLKNGGDVLGQLVDVMQFSVNEQCVQYNECDLYQPFIEQNKPVFHIEYTEKSPAAASFVTKSCTNKGAKGFSTLIKHMSLDAWTTKC